MCVLVVTDMKTDSLNLVDYVVYIFVYDIFFSVYSVNRDVILCEFCRTQEKKDGVCEGHSVSHGTCFFGAKTVETRN